ncbi:MULTISPECIES: sigma 54-interacting transcriptional regulator [Clostridium]|uniref:sigma 54-interacting transcriptional regulator n=1 Tax=Clostridium TaxID=1485 RepID=UPI00115C0DD4|nr:MULTISPECIES: sigma 54-interacting transcriptional regulator [Clostridium]MBS5306651.1 sigma 54-interacting transcriptional regulator [Clostridium sp.]MDB1944671.1 sigma 54-interacting transcriptional regulator [Clostridium tertium]MDB1952147.1 sigma 54-interacting transcriptional regulator [Clostridium tertium]MDB1969029.1 sigma 54-interacting transcriptional regulator [Clostridium tertium]MDU1277401.1 sigma 54-interacting transcriptional regulator [Clostridium sp.]
MINKILEVIEGEDKKNPYTDEELAEKLNVDRKVITKCRKNNHVQSSRDRQKDHAIKDAIDILKVNKNISERAFTTELNKLGYNIARYSSNSIRKTVLEQFSYMFDNNECLEKYSEEKDSKQVYENDTFKRLIGYNGSLSIQISQAKAAVLYPPKGLHTLLLGPSGVGKSQVAECMYEFARTSKVISENAPFVVFNCADYADNPQLLLSQLFGYEKGAFTGANNDKQGLVEKCNGGILFLDEVHRLPNEGQEMLFYLLDKGKFRRLGESESLHESDIMIIAATTEDVKASLLLTFRRRIPMVIELPALSERPVEERFEIIKKFLVEESLRVRKDILVKGEVINALMSYDCIGNIGELKSDIQVSCARGFLTSKINNIEQITISLQEISSHIKESKNVNKFQWEDVIFTSCGSKEIKDTKDKYEFDFEIYDFIEKKYNELKELDYAKKSIDRILGEQVERELNKFAFKFKVKPEISKEELYGIVNYKIIYAVEEAIKVANIYIKDLLPKLFYPLVIHLNSAYERIINIKEITNPQLDYVKENYNIEFKTAKAMAKVINKNLNVELPEDEIGFIAMYLKNFRQKINGIKGKVSVVILSHGHVAKGMADVVNKLLGVSHAVGLEMNLTDSPTVFLGRVIELVKKVDDGKGCILLIDMGSLANFGRIITNRTGIKTEVIDRVDTVLALEVVRRAILPESTLKDIVIALKADKKLIKNNYEGQKKFPLAIITLCITGEGTALKIKNYIEESIPDKANKVSIIPIGIISSDNVTDSIEKLRINYNIIAIVGTIDSEYPDIPFISIDNLVNGRGLIELKKLINREFEQQNDLQEIITSKLIFNNVTSKFKDEILDMMIKSLINYGYVKKEYFLSVYKREAVSNTFIKGGIAIPHGEAQFVAKPTIAIAKLAKPIIWDGTNSVDLIFLIAINKNSKKYIEQLYRLISMNNVLDSLRKAKKNEEIEAILTNNTFSTK